MLVFCLVIQHAINKQINKKHKVLVSFWLCFLSDLHGSVAMTEKLNMTHQVFQSLIAKSQ